MALSLQIKSRPIIEHTTAVRFAPLPDRLPYGACASNLASADLLGDLSQLWNQVDDFGWIKTVQSPNWAEIPEAERSAMPVPENVTVVAGASAHEEPDEI